MLVIRLAALIAVVVIACSIATYLITGDRRYRLIAWKSFKVLLAVVLVVLSLFALERVFAPLI